MLENIDMKSLKDKLTRLKPERTEYEEMERLSEEYTEQNKAKTIANKVINIVLVIAIIMAAVCTYVSFVSTSGNGVPSILGVRVFSIQTKSMYPTFESGDLIFDKAVKDSSELEIGDIITYWTVIDGQRVLNTHRIIQIYDGGGYLIFETQGDNNTVADALTVHESEIVGKYNGFKLKGVGKIFDYLQTSTGFLIVIVIPVAIFFLYHLIQFFRVLFEYNNIKNKLLYEQERGKTEDIVEDEKKKIEEARRTERERLEQELRDKLKAEIYAASGITAPSVETLAVPEKTAEESLAEERVAMEARVRAQMEAEAKAKAEAEAKALAEAKAKAEAEARERAEVEARIRAEMEAEARAKAEAEKLAAERAEMEARIRAEMEAEARAKAEAEKLAAERAEMEARIRAEMEAEARAKAEEEARAKLEAEAKAKAEAERKAAMEAEIRAKIKAEMEAEARAKAEGTQV